MEMSCMSSDAGSVMPVSSEQKQILCTFLCIFSSLCISKGLQTQNKKDTSREILEGTGRQALNPPRVAVKISTEGSLKTHMEKSMR